MESFNFSLNKQIALGGIKKAIPNMIYGNTLFIISLIVRPLLFGASREYLFLVAALSIIFFVGILVAAAPTIISGALLALWLKKDKNVISTRDGVGRGGLIGAVAMGSVCALIYLIDQPHGLPNPSFPLNAGKAIIISTLAGTITGVQLTKDFLKSNS